MSSKVCIPTGAFGVLVTLFSLVIVVALVFVSIVLRKYYLKKRKINEKKQIQKKASQSKSERNTKLKSIFSPNKYRKREEEPWEIDYRKIKFKDKLAKGNFGEVWVGTWLGSPVAIKTVISRMAKDQEFIDRFILEIKLMSNLHHPNIVMFLGACVTPVERMCLVLEYCVFGNMHEFLQQEDSSHSVTITLHMIIKFATDIARGVHYIHQKKNIIQRDLKSRNVLIDSHLNAKVADFGLSRLKEEDANLTACGTPAWTAPEIVRMEQYDEKVDVYSFGIVMWELITREEPYGGQGGVQIAYAAAEQGLRPLIPSTVPDNYSKLMEACWSEDPNARPEFGEILETLFIMMKGTPNPALKELERLKSMKKINGPSSSKVA